ncbi:alpha/beta fold hydrolase [Neisseriaceae bacterium PsAf]|nr:alpha/beta fold hydrolase [Neisseriaceae bacterium PsAf]MCV2503496.1 hypothetical protein [Neisseriaceae bacterium]
MNAQKVVLLHGLFCNGRVMFWLSRKLHQLGYTCLCPSYPTLKQSVEEGARDLEKCIREFTGEDSVFFVGHSMGGIMIRYLQYLFPDLFENSRVVTLGTPHKGSQFGQVIHEKWPAFVLGKSWQDSLDGNVPLWNPKIPLLSIGGTKTNIENRVMRVFPKDEINDGLVAILETEMPEFKAYQRIHQSHLFLCFNTQVVNWIDEWFRQP